MEIFASNRSNDTGDLCRSTSNISDEANGVFDHFERRSLAENIAGCIVTLFISLVSITGNLAVIFVSFWKENLYLQQGNLFIVYLSVIDVLTAVFVMIPSAISVAFDRWVFGHVLCKAHATIHYWFICSSSQTLTLISIDRTIALLYPLMYNNLMLPQRVLKFCGVVLFISFCVGLSGGVPNWVSYNYAEGVCAAEYTKNPKTHIPYTCACFICFYIPVAILSFCYTLIIITVKKSSNKVQPFFIRRKNNNVTLDESFEHNIYMKKTIKSMIAVGIMYYLCFAPYSIGRQLETRTGRDMPLWFKYLSTILIFTSSATNPFIYAFLRKNYRDAFRKLVKLNG